MRPKPVEFAEVQQAVQQLQGRPVLQSQLESDTTHIFALRFGSSSADEQLLQELVLTVHCAWRTVEAMQILCTWNEAIEGYAIPALASLEGLPVTSVALTEWGDLSLQFATGRVLQIWNDAPYEDGDAWLLHIPGRGNYAVATRNEFTHQAAG